MQTWDERAPNQEAFLEYLRGERARQKPAAVPVLKRLRETFCRIFHGRPMHPFRGEYRCRVCLRSYPVRWGSIPKARPDAPERRRHYGQR